MDKKRQDISYFISFCIEQYKRSKQLTGLEAMEQLCRYKVLDYLCDYYEILHTQSRQWLIEDIDEFINRRKAEEL